MTAPIFLLLLIFLRNANTYNILVYSPSFAGSHTNFMARLADTLTENGHDVTFLVPVVDEARKNQLSVKTTKDVVIVEQDEEMRRHVQPMDEEMDHFWETDVTSSNTDTIFSVFSDAMFLACENFLRNKKVFDEMKSRNFDVGIYEPLSVCGLGFMNAIGIEKTIMAASFVFFGAALDTIGEPIDLSYVPGQMSKCGDQMSLSEKVENYRLSMALQKMNFDIWDGEMQAYRKYLGQNLPDWRDLMAGSSLQFTNSIPYVDFPRTITQKTVPIGGITVDMESIKSQTLSREWSKVMDERQYNMLISFGSLVRSKDMPMGWRNSLLEAIKSESNVTFIWKYESDDTEWARGATNIHCSKWVPQTALLNDPRLTAFLTHGGLGSTNELAHLGTPALMVPIFADQGRNAHMLARHGGAIVLQKRDLGNVMETKKAISSILHDETYKKNAQKVADLLNNQPVNPKEQVVKYVEFVAKFGPFPEMDPRGRKLGFIERNLLDVYFIIGLPYFLSFIFVSLAFRFGSTRLSQKIG